MGWQNFKMESKKAQNGGHQMDPLDRRTVPCNLQEMDGHWYYVIVIFVKITGSQ